MVLVVYVGSLETWEHLATNCLVHEALCSLCCQKSRTTYFYMGEKGKLISTA